MKQLNAPPTTVPLRIGIASSRARPCICCGEMRASPSIPACWDHWIALPEDLRSELVVSVGRGQIGRYGDCLMEAVRFWRQTGLWRSRYVKTKSAPQESILAVSSRGSLSVRPLHTKHAIQRRRQKLHASPRSAAGLNDRRSANVTEPSPAATSTKR